MKPISITRPILIFGLVGGALTALLRAVEYRFLILQHSFEVYGGLIALVFIALGIWLGLSLTKRTETVVIKEVTVPVAVEFSRDPGAVAAAGLTPRELQILELIAAGLSNKEIAERIFVSENTVKTHSRRLFEKLNARRRTQAVQAGKELGILP